MKKCLGIEGISRHCCNCKREAGKNFRHWNFWKVLPSILLFHCLGSQPRMFVGSLSLVSFGRLKKLVPCSTLLLMTMRWNLTLVLGCVPSFDLRQLANTQTVSTILACWFSRKKWCRLGLNYIEGVKTQFWCPSQSLLKMVWLFRFKGTCSGPPVLVSMGTNDLTESCGANRDLWCNLGLILFSGLVPRYF